MSRKPVLSPATVTIAISGLVLMITAVWWLGSSARPPERAAPEEPGLRAASGVQAREVSSARRLELDPAAVVEDDAPELRLPDIQPQGEPDVVVAAELRAPSVAPPSMMVVTDEMQAAQAAHDERRASVASQLQAQLAGQRSALRSACWTAELRGSVEAAAYKVSASFDAEGKPLSLAISDERAGPGVAGAPAVGQCLREQLVEVGDVSPGASVAVDVPLMLP